jgi:putative transposase
LQNKLPFFINKKGVKQQFSTSKQIKYLTIKRNNKIKDYIHKSTKYIVDYCIKNHIDNVVLGKNTSWKTSIKLGKRTNQNFVQIPFNSFELYLSYKLQKEGINFKVREESYTSICSSLDLEPIQKHTNYKGKRIKRGLFKSFNGKVINADVNGALNILRKEAGDNILNNILLGRGLVVSPYKLNF